jgi:hypothetical protein
MSCSSGLMRCNNRSHAQLCYNASSERWRIRPRSIWPPLICSRSTRCEGLHPTDQILGELRSRPDSHKDGNTI